MKKITILLLTLFLGGLTFAQDYDINFTSSSTIDSIQVYNMAKDESITISGSDVLNLQPLGINSLDAEKYNISLYPNPAQSSILSFESPGINSVNIKIYNTEGKIISEKNHTANSGLCSYRISGLASGIYMVRLGIDGKYHSSTLSVCNSKANNPKIELSSANAATVQTKSTKSEMETVIMDYDFQEYLRFTAYSGNAATVRVEKPISDLSLDFKFQECIDYDGNNYHAVQIGDQLWMGENLKSENDANGNSISKECYNSQASNCETYGGLYLWNTIMNGESSTDNAPSGVQGICPDGWHLPSDQEWKDLEIELGMSVADANSTGDRGLDEGSELAGYEELWDSNILTDENDFGTTGFDAKPAGLIDHVSGSYYIGQQTYFWTCTEKDGSTGWIRNIKYNMTRSLRSTNDKANALPVRCVKN